MGDERPSRTQTFLEIAHVLRKRSTCLRGKVGCVIVQDKRIIASGYNGSPPDAPHCFELGCDVDENNHEAGCQRTVHAEANAIAWAARAGVSTEGAILYCTHGPCLKCAQLIISAGIEKVVFEVPYRKPEGLALLAHVGVEATQWKDGVELTTGIGDPPSSEDGVLNAFHFKGYRRLADVKTGYPLSPSDVSSLPGLENWESLTSRPLLEWTWKEFADFYDLVRNGKSKYGLQTITLQL